MAREGPLRHHELAQRLDGLQRKGDREPLRVGYETTARRRSLDHPHIITLAFRGSDFAHLTDSSLIVWHNHSTVTETFKRQINRVLSPFGHVCIVRNDTPYLLRTSSEDQLRPFIKGEPFLFHNVHDPLKEGSR